MLKTIVRFIGASLALTIGFAQTPTPAPAPSTSTPLAFEVASVKPAIPLQEQALSGKMHIGVNIDKARVDIGGMSLMDLMTMAYKVKPHQIVGPDWLNIDRFDIVGKMPEGADKEQLPQLLQSLLAERFGLKFHKDQKEHAIYALIVAKGGPKLKESPPDDPPPNPDAEPPKPEKGFTTLNAGGQQMQVKQTGNGAEMKMGAAGNMKMTMEDGHMRMQMSKMNMEGLAAALSRFVDKPVVDMTELKGNFQMTIELSMDDLQNVARSQGMQMPGAAPSAASSSRPAESVGDPSGSTIFSSVGQMGLKLDARKAPIETIIIDHVEKTPTEN